MSYKVYITPCAEEHIENIVEYIINNLSNKQAAQNFLKEVSHALKQLELWPLSFPACDDKILALKGYRKLVLGKYRYVIIYRMEKQNIYILGVFHTLEDYITKM